MLKALANSTVDVRYRTLRAKCVVDWRRRERMCDPSMTPERSWFGRPREVNQTQCDISRAPDRALSMPVPVSDVRAHRVRNHGIGGMSIRTCTCEWVNY